MDFNFNLGKLYRKKVKSKSIFYGLVLLRFHLLLFLIIFVLHY